MVYFAPRRRPERRQGKDFWLKLLSLLGIITAVIVTALMMLLVKAKPDTFSSMDPQYLPLRAHWNRQFVDYCFYLLVIGFFTSSFGLIVNSRRLKRKHDHVHLNLVFLWIVSVAGMVTYFVWTR